MTQRIRGFALLSTLAITVVLLMMIAVLLKRGESGLYRSSHYRDGLIAVQAARGGANHLLALLEDNEAYSSDQTVSLGHATYTFTFDASRPYYCVNNLGSATAATQLSALGHTVPPHTADLFLIGKSGNTSRVVHVVVHHGLSASGSVSAVGRVRLSGDVEVEGIKSLLPPSGQGQPEPAAGGIVSKYRSPSSGDPAISWDGTGSFTLSNLSRLEAAPVLTGGLPVSSQISSLYPDSIVRSAAADTIPEIDVAGIVTTGLSSTPLPGVVAGVCSGYVYVPQDHSVAGDLTVNGNLELVSGGTLYVDGDLTVNGTVNGTGAVYVSGDIHVLGGDAVVSTSEPQGTALMAAGDISLEGLDAAGYLDTLGSSYGFTGDVNTLKNFLSSYTTATTAGAFWGLAVDIGKHNGPSSGPTYVSPIPGPDGTHNFGFANGAAARVALDIKNLHPGYSTDPRAQKVVRALEQVQYHFRHNLHNVAHDGLNYTDQAGTQIFTLGTDYQLYDSGGNVVPETAYAAPPNAMLNMAWDDAALPLAMRSHDSLQWNANDPLHRARRDAFFEENDPLALNWLGRSSFQGLVYARGDLSVQTNFTVVGALISLGDVTLSHGSRMVFNEEYKDLRGSQLPLGLVMYEEI